MTATNFLKAMPYILRYEGGYSNHPVDPGGVTLQGVIQRVYDGYRKNHGKPLQHLTRELMNTTAWPRERDEIYRLQYWNQCLADELPSGVDFVVFDGAVNSGPSQSIKWLQRALGNVVVDGVCGQATLRAADAYPDKVKLIKAICDIRRDFLRHLRTYATFGEGWRNRVASVQSIGSAWAAGGTIRRAEAVSVIGGDARALAADAKPAKGTAVADGTTGAGATITATLTGLKDDLGSVIGGSEWGGKVIVTITVVVGLITIGSLAYRWWVKRQNEARALALGIEVE